MQSKRSVTLRSKASFSETFAFACSLFLFCMFLYNQLVYGMDMLLLIVFTGVLSAAIFLFCLLSEEYRFGEHALEVVCRFRKTQVILYADMFNYEADLRDSFLNLLQSDSVKVYYTKNGKKRFVLCRPREGLLFVEALKANCPEFFDEDVASTIDVLFEEGKK
ncbi:MAG: hypothetical protein IKT43_04500 [Clostridia bacterium]|nr:hypothetical protein [Clostridia bacterium]